MRIKVIFLVNETLASAFTAVKEDQDAGDSNSGEDGGESEDEKLLGIGFGFVCRMREDEGGDVGRE